MNIMKFIFTARALCLIIIAALLTLLASACKQKESTEVASTQAALLSAPAKDDDTAWRQYLVEITKQHMGNISNNPFIYYLGPQSDTEFEEKFERQVGNVKAALARGIAADNMLAFGSPASARMAELIENTFAEIDENAMKGVRILFIGESADNDRVTTAVQATGADYIFVEAK